MYNYCSSIAIFEYNFVHVLTRHNIAFSKVLCFGAFMLAPDGDSLLIMSVALPPAKYLDKVLLLSFA